MSTMLVEFYDAFVEAGASAAKARAAAATLVIERDRLERIEAKTDTIQDEVEHARTDIARLDQEVAVVQAQIEPLTWMNGIVIAGIVALIIKTFFA